MDGNILVVDDSATTRGLIKRVIRMAGIDAAAVLEAPHGRAALDILHTQSVQLILADLHMPEMTGVELTQHVLSDPLTRHIPVVIVSAEPSDERIAALKAQGIKGHLRKPFTPEQLRDLVQELLGVSHA